MKIGTKLLVLISALLAAIVFASVIFILNFTRIQQIENERIIFSELTNSIYEVHIASSMLLTYPFEATEDTLGERIHVMEEVFAKLDTLTYLPNINSEIRNNIDIIKRLKDRQTEHKQELLDYNAEIKRKVQEVAGAIYGFTVEKLPTNYTISSKGKSDEFRQIVSGLIGKIAIYTTDLRSAIDLIHTYEFEINKEIRNISFSGILFSGIIAFLFLVFGVITGTIIARTIRRSVITITREVGMLSTGDLRGSFRTFGRDEISDLSKALNGFLDKLRKTIAIIQGESAANKAIKDELLLSVEESSSAIEQIQANLESIIKQFTALSKTLGTSVASAENINRVVTGVNAQIEEQTSMVEESTASVTQMISSIQSVAKTTELNKDTSLQLVATSEAGGKKLRETTQTITEISSNIEEIKGMANLIQTISAQTNLLAMNAAIEAAHAGDAGNGFSVVADEIRKLAEASAVNSKRISKTLQSIVGQITSAVTSATETTKAFSEINNQVTLAERSFSEIYDSMKELEIGGSQILEAMVKLQDVSLAVTNGSREMEKTSSSVRKAFADVESVSSQATSGVNEIAVGIKDISQAIERLLSISSRIQAVSGNLEESVAFFTIADGKDE